MGTVDSKVNIGQAVFAHDGTKLGKVKGYLGDDATGEFVVVGRFLARDLVVPASAIESADDRVVLSHSSSFIDCAPAVNAKCAISAEDASRLEEFYRAAAS